MIVAGAVLAVWSLTGAMKTLMWALNIAYDVPERRGFFRTRIAAVAMLACAGTAFVLVFALLVLGPQLSNWVGSAVDQPTAVSWVWWTAQWPVLVGALLVAFGGIYRFGPDLEHPNWRVVTPVLWSRWPSGWPCRAGSPGTSRTSAPTTRPGARSRP